MWAELSQMVVKAVEGSVWGEDVGDWEEDELRMCGDLAVAPIKGKGRGLVATRHIPRGTLLAAETPLATSLGAANTGCTFCAAPLPLCPLEPCLACPGLAFCSPDCWEEESKLFHWLHCGAVGADTGNPGTLFRLAIRLYLATPPSLRYVWSKTRPISLHTQLQDVLRNEETSYLLAASLPVHDFENHYNYPSYKERIDLIADRIVSLGRNHGFKAKEIKRQLLHVMAVVITNSFTVYRRNECKEPAMPSDKSIGVGLYPAVSLLNHSCIPNTTRIFEGTRMLMRIIRDVAPGEELTTTYGTNVKTQTTYHRRVGLTNWAFRCYCADACGSFQFRNVEAEFWGFACPHCANGAAMPVHEPWTPDTAYKWASENDWDLDRIIGSLKILCVECDREGTVGAQMIRDLVSAMRVLRYELPYRSDLADLVAALHPGNHIRLQALWTVQYNRALEAGSFDAEAVDARVAVHANVARLYRGWGHFDVATDAFHAARALAKLPASPPATAAFRRFRATVLDIITTYFGPESPEVAALTNPCWF